MWAWNFRFLVAEKVSNAAGKQIYWAVGLVPKQVLVRDSILREFVDFFRMVVKKLEWIAVTYKASINVLLSLHITIWKANGFCLANFDSFAVVLSTFDRFL